VPGATEVNGSAEDGFEATVVQKVGPVKATFKGLVSLTDMVPAQSLKISGEGRGGQQVLPRAVRTCVWRKRTAGPS